MRIVRRLPHACIGMQRGPPVCGSPTAVVVSNANKTRAQAPCIARRFQNPGPGSAVRETHAAGHAIQHTSGRCKGWGCRCCWRCGRRRAARALSRCTAPGCCSHWRSGRARGLRSTIPGQQCCLLHSADAQSRNPPVWLGAVRCKPGLRTVVRRGVPGKGRPGCRWGAFTGVVRGPVQRKEVGCALVLVYSCGAVGRTCGRHATQRETQYAVAAGVQGQNDPGPHSLTQTAAYPEMPPSLAGSHREQPASARAPPPPAGRGGRPRPTPRAHRTQSSCRSRASAAAAPRRWAGRTRRLPGAVPPPVRGWSGGGVAVGGHLTAQRTARASQPSPPHLLDRLGRQLVGAKVPQHRVKAGHRANGGRPARPLQGLPPARLSQSRDVRALTRRAQGNCLR